MSNSLISCPEPRLSLHLLGSQHTVFGAPLGGIVDWGEIGMGTVRAVVVV